MRPKPLERINSHPGSRMVARSSNADGVQNLKAELTKTKKELQKKSKLLEKETELNKAQATIEDKDRQLRICLARMKALARSVERRFQAEQDGF